jgi:hypothetical protein
MPHYSRRLPHWDIWGDAVFVTFRLPATPLVPFAIWLKSLKSYTRFQAIRILGAVEPFWQSEVTIIWFAMLGSSNVYALTLNTIR